jgi:hypothetical protein
LPKESREEIPELEDEVSESGAANWTEVYENF